MRSISYTLLLLFGYAAAVAETTGPIQVEADRLELDQKKGVSLYQGHVRLQRGKTLLRAERLELHGASGKVTLAIADGQPVHLEMRDQESGRITRAEAQHVEYRFNEKQIELLGKARLWRDGDRFSGEKLLYDDGKQQVHAFGNNEQNNGRVRVILQPEKEQKQ